MFINPYIVGNPIGEEQEFYGRTDIFRTVSGVLHHPRKNAIVLYGQRRIGKTSVLLQLERQLRDEAKFTPIYFDLMSWAGRPLADLLFSLAQHTNFALQLPAPDKTQFDAHGEYFQQTILPQAAKAAAEKGLVFLFDEFDVLAAPQQEQADEAFFPYLSQLLNKDSRIQFVFVIGRRPAELSSRTIGAFRTVESAQVALMSREDSLDIIRQSEKNDSLRWPEAAAEAVWQQTQGHPYFTQLIASAVWDKAHEDDPEETPVARPEWVTAVRHTAFRTGANAFAWLWDGLPPAERIIMAAIAEAEQDTLSVDDVVEILNSRGVQMFVGELEVAPKTLVNWGVLQQTDGGYRVAVPLLRYWVQKNKPLRQTKDEIDKIEPLAMQLFKTGQGFLSQNRYSESEGHFRQALEQNPNHFQAKASLGFVLLEQGKMEEAIQVLEEAYASDPTPATRAHLIRALLATAAQQTTEDEKLNRYEQILAIMPTHSAARAGKQAIETARRQREQKRLAAQAEEYESSQSWLQAAKLYRELVERFPDGAWQEKLSFTESQRQEQWLAQQEALFNKHKAAEDWAEAKAISEKILQKFPENEQWQTWQEDVVNQTALKQKYEEALAAFDQNDLNTAQQLLTDIIRQQPDYKEALNYLVRAINKVDVPALQKEIAKLRDQTETAAASRQRTMVYGSIIIIIIIITGFFVGGLLGWMMSGTGNDTATVTQTPFPPAGAGTPYPAPITAIDTTNVDQVTKLARWGKGRVTKGVYSPDGNLLAVAGSIGIYLYETTEWEEVAFIDTESWITDVTFSPEGTTLASGSGDGTIRLWRVSDGELLHTLEGHTGSVRSVAFSPEGTTLASGSGDGTIRLWRVSDGELLRTLEGHAESVRSVAFSPGGMLLASGSGDNTVRLWWVSDGELLRTLKGHTDDVNSVAFSPDGTLLASGSDDNTVRLWQISNGELLQALKGHTVYDVSSVAFSPEGTLLASGSWDSTARLWRVSDGELLQTLEDHTDGVNSVAFSPEGTTLVSGSFDGTVRLWRVSDGELLQALEGYAGSARSLAFSPDGTLLASGSWDGTVWLWRVSDGTLLGTLEGHTSVVSSVAFSPDGTTLASGSGDNTIRLWRVSDGELLQTLEGHTGYVTSVAFSPEGTTLVSGSFDGTVRLWRVSDGELLHTLEGHTSYVRSVAFSPEGTTLASGSGDGTIRLWRVSDGELLQTLKGHTSSVISVAFSPEGTTLASGSWDNTIRLWRVSDGGLLQTLEGHAESVRSVAFSPEGTLLASGLGDNTVQMWRVSDGILLRTLEGHTSSVTSVAFSPKGITLASGSGDGTVRLWGIAP